MTEITESPYCSRCKKSWPPGTATCPDCGADLSGNSRLAGQSHGPLCVQGAMSGCGYPPSQKEKEETSAQ